MPTRRRFLAGLGSLLTSGSIIASSGAFETVSAANSASVRLVGDDAGRLAMTSTSEYVDQDDMTMDLHLDRLNAQSKTTFEGLFEVTNTGDDSLAVAIEDSFADAVQFSFGGESAQTTLGPGQSASVGLVVDTCDVSQGELGEGTLSLRATEDV
jgi:hypothetical protein